MRRRQRTLRTSRAFAAILGRSRHRVIPAPMSAFRPIAIATAAWSLLPLIATSGQLTSVEYTFKCYPGLPQGAPFGSAR